MKIIFWYVKDFFAFIGQCITLIFDILVNIGDILVACVKFLVSVVSALPTFAIVAASALIIVCVLYKVLGREASS
jgi:hypothetical protein